jgi:hypothetical protein
VRPEDGQARPKHVVTFDNKIQNQDSCVIRQTPPPSFDLHDLYFSPVTPMMKARSNVEENEPEGKREFGRE